MRQDVYYQRGAPDPVLDESLVMEIVHKYAPEAKTIKRIDESGGEARTYHVDANITLKVQRPQQLRMSTSLEKEAFFLKQLEKNTDVNVPRVLGYGRHGTVEYTCMTRIPGICVKNATLSDDELKAVLLELGQTLRKIHGIDQKPFAGNKLFPCDDPPDLKERLLRRAVTAIQKKIESAGQAKTDAAIKAVERELEAIKNTGSFVALHVNPAKTHTFVDEKNHRYTGLIDFGDAYIGHPVFDFWRWPVPERKTLLKGYTTAAPVSNEFMIILETANAIDDIADNL